MQNAECRVIRTYKQGNLTPSLPLEGKVAVACRLTDEVTDARHPKKREHHLISHCRKRQMTASPQGEAFLLVAFFFFHCCAAELSAGGVDVGAELAAHRCANALGLKCLGKCRNGCLI